jgi:hypothetical protein
MLVVYSNYSLLLTLLEDMFGPRRTGCSFYLSTRASRKFHQLGRPVPTDLLRDSM